MKIAAVGVILFLAFVAMVAAGFGAYVSPRHSEVEVVTEPLFVATLLRLAVLLVLAALGLVYFFTCRRADAAAEGGSHVR